MKPPSPLVQVFRKELRDMFRDKRVRSSAFIVPIFLIVAIIGLFGFVFQSLSTPESRRVHVVETQNEQAREVLAATKFTIVPVATLQEGIRMIEQGRARVVIEVEEAPHAPGQLILHGYFDPKQQVGQITFSVLEQAFALANKEALRQYLLAQGIPESVQEPVKLERHEVQVGEEGGAGEFVLGMLPYFIVVWAFYGGFGIVSDLVAGEKEKSTLETLLITPVHRSQIVLGKFFALCVVCLLSALSSVVGLALVAVLPLPGADQMLQDGLGLTPTSFAIILLLLLPAVAFFASLLLAISTYAKNPREAQTHLGVVSVAVIMPAVFSQVIGFTDLAAARWINLVPVLNTAMNIRAAMLGKPDPVALALTIGTGAVLAAIGLLVVLRLFCREEVLTRV
jgi:sodium transport system permease protein